MTARTHWLLLPILLVSIVGHVCGDDPKEDKDLKDLATYLTGAFSSEAQSKADNSYFDIRLHMTPIWPELKEGYWFYVEQARADMLDQPYRQRVYHVQRSESGMLESVVYELPDDPLKYAGAWKETALLKDLKPEALRKKEGCDVVLKRLPDGSFKGGTEGKGCASGLRGAAYATAEVEVYPDSMNTWDRGFDKDGNQVWGAVKGPYQFKRVREAAVR